MSPTPSLSTTLGMRGLLAAVVLLVALLIIGLSATGVLGALLSPSPASDEAAAAATEQQRAERFSARFEGDLAQLEGRSMFFLPTPPPPPPAPEPVIEERNEPPPPPPPARYAGPRLVGLMNETAWFSDGRQLSVGDDADRGLRLVGVDAPWSARVEWDGVEFTIDLFLRDSVVIPPDEREEQLADQPAAEATEASPEVASLPPEDEPSSSDPDRSDDDSHQ